MSRDRYRSLARKVAQAAVKSPFKNGLPMNRPLLYQP